MSDGRRASAPGKLVLLGEYSVLLGAPAVVMAVNRRALVTLEAAPGDRWIVTAPGLVTEAAEFGMDASGRISWNESEAGDRLALVERVIEGLVALGKCDPATTPSQVLDLDTTAFFDTGSGGRRKLGLGSSAALTVALASAVTGPENRASSGNLEWLQTLVSLHRDVQGGLGSGIDVAASLYGGVVGFQLDAGGTVAAAAPIHWPGEILRTCVWTGQSAKTGSFLDRLQASRAGGSGAADEVLDRLGQVSERGVDSLARNDPFRFLDAVDRFCEALADLGRVIDMPIVSDAHRRLRRLAADCGVHYKPSGAGGGDVGVGFSTERDRIHEFSRRAAAAGFATPDLDLDLDGAVVSGM